MQARAHYLARACALSKSMDEGWAPPRSPLAYLSRLLSASELSS